MVALSWLLLSDIRRCSLLVKSFAALYLLSQMLPHLETLSCEFKCEEIGHICSTYVAFEAPLFERCKIECILQVTYSSNARNVFLLPP